MTGQRQRFSSAILPVRAQGAQGPRGVAVAVLHGLSSMDFHPALEQFLCTEAGLSVVTITRLTTQ
jgi:hypothetical protein